MRRVSYIGHITWLDTRIHTRRIGRLSSHWPALLLGRTMTTVHQCQRVKALRNLTTEQIVGVTCDMM